MPLRTVLSHAAFAIALASGAAAAWLIFIGGVDFSIAGVEVTSHEPLRPLAVVALALAVRAWARGLTPTRDRWDVWLRRTGERRLAIALASIVTVVGLVYCTTAATAADSYGYVSQAELWQSRSLRVPQPWAAEVPWPDARWTFAPLGYRPMEGEGQWDLVPVYSPGLPLLMAAAKTLGGQEGVFWIGPIAGGVLVLATFGIGSRLGSPRAGLIAAWLVATSPIVLFMLMPPMSDLPVTAAWTAALCLAFGRGAGNAFLSGVLTAIAILIRPNLAPLGAVIGLWFLISRSEPLIRTRVRRLGTFVAGVLPGPLIIAAVYTALHGSPFVSGYGGLESMFAWSHVLPNLRNYLTWFIESQTIVAVAGLIAIALPIGRVWPWLTDRRALAIIVLFVGFLVAQYATYLVFDTWWFLRFFLPAWPFVMLGVAAMALLAMRSGRAGISLLVSLGVVALGVLGAHESRQRGAFDMWSGERRFVDIAQFVSGATPPGTIIYTLLHSGSMRYYGSRLTLRSDILDPAWLDRSVAWLRDRGRPVYLLLEEWEIDEFKRRFAGQSLASELDARLAFVYRGPTLIRLYDLSGPRPAAPVNVPIGNLNALRSVPPSPRAFSFDLTAEPASGAGSGLTPIADARTSGSRNPR